MTQPKLTLDESQKELQELKNESVRCGWRENIGMSSNSGPSHLDVDQGSLDVCKLVLLEDDEEYDKNNALLTSLQEVINTICEWFWTVLKFITPRCIYCFEEKKDEVDSGLLLSKKESDNGCFSILLGSDVDEETVVSGRQPNSFGNSGSLRSDKYSLFPSVDVPWGSGAQFGDQSHAQLLSFDGSR